MESAVGIPEEQLRRAARSAVCKVNIDSDGRLAMTAVIRKVFAENPSEFDPRKYLGPARDELIKMVKHKNENVLGSASLHVLQTIPNRPFSIETNLSPAPCGSLTHMVVSIFDSSWVSISVISLIISCSDVIFFNEVIFYFPDFFNETSCYIFEC